VNVNQPLRQNTPEAPEVKSRIVSIRMPENEYQFYAREAEALDRPVSWRLLQRIRHGGLVQVPETEPPSSSIGGAAPQSRSSSGDTDAGQTTAEICHERERNCISEGYTEGRAGEISTTPND
jgi:hypothetical protein